jgi:hypothetical protein
VKRSGKRRSRARNIAGTSVSIVVLELGTIWPIRMVMMLSLAGLAVFAKHGLIEA